MNCTNFRLDPEPLSNAEASNEGCICNPGEEKGGRKIQKKKKNTFPFYV